jgi:hypothetical protein
MARDTYSLPPAVSHFAKAVRAANNTRRSTSFTVVDHHLTITLSKFLRVRRSFVQSRGSLSLQFLCGSGRSKRGAVSYQFSGCLPFVAFDFNQSLGRSRFKLAAAFEFVSN